jgi:hypothetical protein
LILDAAFGIPIAMKLRHWITAISLLLLVAAAITGTVWTRALRPPPESDDSTATPADKRLLARTQAANERPLQTARRMAALAVTPEELRLAHEAEKVGDHEAGLAFADELGTAALNPAKLTAEAKEVGARKAKADAAVKADQETITGTNCSSPFLRIRIPMQSSNNHGSLVAKDTENNTRKAEEEWRRRHPALPSALFLRGAAINVRLTACGVELRGRSITRAYKRHETGQRRYEAVVELMHKKPEEVAR